jgi:hypothetical protein
LEFTGWPIAAINRASLLFTASLWQAAVMVSCASPRIQSTTLVNRQFRQSFGL